MSDHTTTCHACRVVPSRTSCPHLRFHFQPCHCSPSHTSPAVTDLTPPRARTSTPHLSSPASPRSCRFDADQAAARRPGLVVAVHTCNNTPMLDSIRLDFHNSPRLHCPAPPTCLQFPTMPRQPPETFPACGSLLRHDRPLHIAPCLRRPAISLLALIASANLPAPATTH